MKTQASRFTLICLVAIFCNGPSIAWAQEEDAVVELGIVIESASSAVIQVPGTVISTRDADIAAELSGRLTWIAEVGEQIEKGMSVAIIDDHLLQLQLRNDEAEIARITADINYNRRQIERLQSLALKNNMAQSELDAIQSRLEMLVQERRIAEVAKDRTTYDLSRTKIAAPFSGIIAGREMSIGEYTTPGSSIVRLVDTSALEISVSAPLRVARFNTPGAMVQVNSGDRQMMTAIRGAVPIGDTRSRMMEVRLKLEFGDWLIGEAVTVELSESEMAKGLSIPRDALVLRDNEVYVYTVSEGNLARKIPVIAGAGHGANISVEGQLKAGDAVVIRGAERLHDGQGLKIVQHHLAAAR